MCDLYRLFVWKLVLVKRTDAFAGPFPFFISQYALYGIFVDGQEQIGVGIVVGIPGFNSEIE